MNLPLITSALTKAGFSWITKRPGYQDEIQELLDVTNKDTASTLAYAATTDIDFTVDGPQTLTLAGAVTFTFSGLAAGLEKEIRIIGDGSIRAFTFPACKFVGAAAPASLAANKVALLRLRSFGTTAGAVIARYYVEP